jgi:hypothetical protein
MFAGIITYGQASLSFCTFVNSPNQECVFENNKFITTPDSTHAKLYMMLRSTELLGTAKLTFKIYGIDRMGKEVYLKAIVQDIKADWMNAWQPEIFNSPGKYMIKVYKDESTLIATKGFEFFNY